MQCVRILVERIKKKKKVLIITRISRNSVDPMLELWCRDVF